MSHCHIYLFIFYAHMHSTYPIQVKQSIKNSLDNIIIEKQSTLNTHSNIRPPKLQIFWAGVAGFLISKRSEKL